MARVLSAARFCAQTSERAERMDWASLAHGAYLPRTSHPSEGHVQLWKWYVRLAQAESAFRAVKSDLSMRPVFHRKEGRVDAHIPVCFLALAMWRTLEQWMETEGLGSCARRFLSEMDKIHSMDVVLPDDTGTELRLRTVPNPGKPLAVLLHRPGLHLPQTPKQIEM